MRFASVLFALSFAACAAPIQSSAPLTAAIPLHQSPTENGDFNFCATENLEAPMNLGNVVWLAYLAANEYSHATVFGPMLASLGFASPQGGEVDWKTCATDLRKLREAQAGREPELRAVLGKPDEMRSLSMKLMPDLGLGNWGSCAQAFVSREDFPRDAFPAAAFQDALVRSVRHGAYLQFFSAGGMNADRTAFQDASTQVVFARHRELPVAVLAFRGTESAERADVVTDLEAWQTPLSDHGWPSKWGSAHAGFVKAWESVAPLVDEKLRELDGSGVKLYVTGHSLGGALATLAFARMLREGAPALGGVQLITFGSPRVGDAAFAAAFREAVKERGARALRVRNGNDAVTRLPGAFFDYEHVGTLVHLKESELAIVTEKDPPYDESSFADHSISGLNQDEWTSGYFRRLRHISQNQTYPELSRCDGE